MRTMLTPHVRAANRTCEMGLRQATGHPYESFVFLLEELTT
jgi:D-lactate dehydrogenase